MNLQTNGVQHRITGKHYVNKDSSRRHRRTGAIIPSKYLKEIPCCTSFCEGTLKVNKLKYERGTNLKKFCKQCTKYRISSCVGYLSYKGYLKLKNTSISRYSVAKVKRLNITTTV